MADYKKEPMSTETSNAGDYLKPRYTCCACYKDIEDGKPGKQECPHCGSVIGLKEGTQPVYKTFLWDNN